MNDLNMNALVSYDASDNSIRWEELNPYYTSNDFGRLTWDYWIDYPEIIREYYPCPTYLYTTRYEDTYKKAFNIAKLLLKKNLLVSRKLKDFIGLVEEIAKEL